MPVMRNPNTKMTVALINSNTMLVLSECALLLPVRLVVRGWTRRHRALTYTNPQRENGRHPKADKHAVPVVDDEPKGDARYKACKRRDEKRDVRFREHGFTPWVNGVLFPHQKVCPVTPQWSLRNLTAVQRIDPSNL